MSWPEAIFVLGTMVVLGTAAIFIIGQAFSTWRARMSVAREEAYRKLAERVTAAQDRAGHGLERAETKLAELERRTAEIERLLKEVE